MTGRGAPTTTGVLRSGRGAARTPSLWTPASRLEYRAARGRVRQIEHGLAAGANGAATA